MVWEATSAENNPQGAYYSAVKEILTGFAGAGGIQCQERRELEARSTVKPWRTPTITTKVIPPPTASWNSSMSQTSVLTTFITQGANTQAAKTTF